MKKYFSIGETAKINNVSIQALRLYDKMGLLKPAHVDPKSNYRYYTIDQFIYLDLIKYSKQIGAPLKEIGDVLHNKDIDLLLSFIKKQQNIVDKEILRLKNIRNAMGYLDDKIKYATEVKATNKIYSKEIEKRFVVNHGFNKDEGESHIEIKLRSLDRILEENEILFEGETGRFIYLDSFLDKGELSYKSLYSTVCIDGIENKGIEICEIPSGKFLCIDYFKKDRERAVDQLRKYIEKNEISPLGIGMEIQLLNTLGEWESDDALYELQILI